MKRSRLVGLALAGGTVCTLLTGLYPLRTPMGATHYGFPLAWLTRLVVAPEYFPWRVNWPELVVDLLVWTVAVLALLVVYDRFSD
jgi:hypothetical protein